MKIDKEKTMPLILSGIIIIIDQITKAFIAIKWPIPEYSNSRLVADVFGNDILKIFHVRNKALAFSMGDGLPDLIKPVLFVVLPLLVLAILVWYYFRSNEFSKMQRWATAGILGGGIGNLIDRIFRPDGVVDFISVKLPGFFEFLFGPNPHWPTFNVADSAVVVCCIMLFITIIFTSKKSEKTVKGNA